MIERTYYLDKIRDDLKQFKVVALLGPRQCGKTTIATQYVQKIAGSGVTTHFFDLEDPDHLNALENAKMVFEKLDGLIVIDEVQRKPEIFPLLRVLVDHHKKKFLILGSASQDLIRQSSETLAGRIIYNEVYPFRFLENISFPLLMRENIWFRGGFPLATLAETDEQAQNWLKSFIRTFLERDIPSFGFEINPNLIRRFWTMLCGYHGQIFNASELGQALDLNHKTTKKYLDILAGTFMMRVLQPWYANIKKRQVKQPKIYFRDSGIFHTLHGIKTLEELLKNVKIGASWEGHAMEEIISYHRAENEDCYFWATHSGAEIDLLINTPDGMKGFEFKFSSKPKITPSMEIALQDLGLKSITVVVPGEIRYPLSDFIEVRGLGNFIGKN